MITKNQQGMGLLESLLAVGVLGGLALVINQFSRNAGKVVTNLEMNDDIKVTLQQIQIALSDSENCTTTFLGRRANNALNVVQAIKKKNATGFGDAFKTISASSTVSYGQKNLKINSYTLSDTAPEVDVVTTGTTQLLVDFNRGNRGMQANSITKKINLRVVVDGAGNITSCVAFDSAVSDIWKLATNNLDIYYNSGHVAVGLTAPTANLTVRASTFPLQPGIAIRGNESGAPGMNRAGVLYSDSSSGESWRVAAFGSSSFEGEGKFGINQNGVNRMIITKNGNVGIGTSRPNCEVTTCENSDVGRVLHVHSTGTGLGDGATVFLSSDSIGTNNIVGSLAFGSSTRPGSDSRVAGITGNTTSPAGSPLEGRMFFWTNTNGTLAWNMILTEVGGLWIRGTFATNALSERSDVRLKRNIQPLSHSLKKINRLEGKSYQWKNKSGKQLGLIAQEVEKVFPETVKLGENGFKSLAYSSLIAPIINSLKELDRSWNEDSKRLEKLKAQNKELKEHLCSMDRKASFCERNSK